MSGNRLPFAADAMNDDDAPPFCEKPKHARVQFADVAQLEEPLNERLGKRLAVIFSIPQLPQARQDGGKILRVALLEFIQKFPHRTVPGRCLIEFYTEFHYAPTSLLMYWNLIH